MVIPVGDQYTQDLIRLVREERGIRQTSLGGCRFVRLLGEHGWKKE
jgi:protein-L-isoaspartate(D-aspartate) O-methyltransferase